MNFLIRKEVEKLDRASNLPRGMILSLAADLDLPTLLKFCTRHQQTCTRIRSNPKSITREDVQEFKQFANKK